MTQRYRTVGLRASVDESLFGELSSGVGKTKSPTKTMSAPSLSQSVIITSSELSRIRNDSVFKSEAELAAEKERAMQVKEQKERQARERKERMKHLEQQAILKAKLSDEEVAQQARDQAIREAATAKIDQRSDVVKVLTSMSARAAAFTLREKQLEEKKHREEVEREYDRSMDMIMELDRIKDIQRREEEETAKRLKRYEDRKVITDQMQARQKIKYLAAEQREQENQLMRMTMKKYQDEDADAAARRKIEIEKSRLEVLKANEIAIERKKELKRLEKKEMEDILVYQAEKDAELRRREEEEKALEKTKKERQALLLAQQERAQNNADKLDEIRARRAAEERERRARQKDKEVQAKKKADMDELHISRAAQAADKRQREEVFKQRQAEEFENALAHMAAMAAREAEEQKRKKELANQHRTNLATQIDEAQRLRSTEFQSKMNEGTALRQDTIKEVAKYCVIRDQMVSDLEAKGINPRFLSEMKSVDVERILKR